MEEFEVEMKAQARVEELLALRAVRDVCVCAYVCAHVWCARPQANVPSALDASRAAWASNRGVVANLKKSQVCVYMYWVVQLERLTAADTIDSAVGVCKEAGAVLDGAGGRSLERP